MGSVEVTLTFPTGKKVATVKAGLFALDGTALSGFAAKEIAFTTSDEMNTAIYKASGVPTGTYLVRFFLYTQKSGDITSTTEVLNRFSESVTVAKSRTSRATREITAFNTEYAITYITPAGMGFDRFGKFASHIV